MNQQERDSLTHFLTQLREARVPEKNAEAEALIREAVASQPDAAYLLVQRALLVEQALEALKAQNARLESEVQALRASGMAAAGQGSFLGGSNPWASQAAGSGAAVPGAGTYQMPRPAAANGTASGVSSFLGSVAATAAGVAAGSFLVQGIENLLGQHAAGSSWLAESGREHAPEQTVINNYYLSDPDGAGDMSDDADFLASGSDDDFLADGDESTWV